MRVSSDGFCHRALRSGLTPLFGQTMAATAARVCIKSQVIDFPRSARLSRIKHLAKSICGGRTWARHFLRIHFFLVNHSGILSFVTLKTSNPASLHWTFSLTCVDEDQPPGYLGHLSSVRTGAREELFTLILKSSSVDLKVYWLFLFCDVSLKTRSSEIKGHSLEWLPFTSQANLLENIAGEPRKPVIGK